MTTKFKIEIKNILIESYVSKIFNSLTNQHERQEGGPAKNDVVNLHASLFH